MNKPNDGCIYTRKWIVDFMLDICGYTSDRDICAWKVIEPSCGTGSFMLRIIPRLLAAAKKRHLAWDCLENSLRGYDTDAAALHVAREATRKLLRASGVDGDMAKRLVDTWYVQRDFVETNISDADLVIGNPPYIRATDIAMENRNRYMESLETFTRGTDIYIAFFEKGLKSLDTGGKLCFICSDRWRRNQFGARLRDFIKRQHFGVHINGQMHNVDAFEAQVTAYPSVTLIDRSGDRAVEAECNEHFDATAAHALLKDLGVVDGAIRDAYTVAPFARGNPYEEYPLITEAGVHIGIGIATGRDKVFVTTDKDAVEPERMVPLAYARDINNHQFPRHAKHWLVNPWQNGRLADLSAYPRLERYFLANEESLKKRHVAQKKPADWYRTIDKLKPGLCESKKLLIRDMSDKTEPIYDDGKLYPHHNLYWMTSDTWDLKVLGGILISDTVYDMMLQNSVDMRGGVIRNQAQYLRKLRVPCYESIAESDREALRVSFEKNDREMASRICERLYA